MRMHALLQLGAPLLGCPIINAHCLSMIAAVACGVAAFSCPWHAVIRGHDGETPVQAVEQSKVCMPQALLNAHVSQPARAAPLAQGYQAQP